MCLLGHFTAPHTSVLGSCRPLSFPVRVQTLKRSTAAEAVFSQLGRRTLFLKRGVSVQPAMCLGGYRLGERHAAVTHCHRNFTGKGRWLSFSKDFRDAGKGISSSVIGFKWSRPWVSDLFKLRISVQRHLWSHVSRRWRFTKLFWLDKIKRTSSAWTRYLL